jgi:N-terminal domain of anti-restriction factor ArdC
MKLEEIKNKTNEAVSYLVAALESGQSDVLTQYLNAMARFHNYSFGNIMLIARQKPQATNVAGIRTWNSLGRFVKRGEKGILILAPMIGRKKTDSAAEPTTDAKESTAQLYGFRAVYVFDVGQTEGKDFPALTEVEGDVSGYRERLVKFVESQNVTLNYSERIAPAKGLSFGGKIILLSGMQPAEEFSTLVHENARDAASGRTPDCDHETGTRDRSRGRGFRGLPVRRTSDRNPFRRLYPALAWRRQAPAREPGSRPAHSCCHPRGHCPDLSANLGGFRSKWCGKPTVLKYNHCELNLIPEAQGREQWPG